VFLGELIANPVYFRETTCTSDNTAILVDYMVKTNNNRDGLSKIINFPA
jgi:hypothetical protein